MVCGGVIPGLEPVLIMYTNMCTFVIMKKRELEKVLKQAGWWFLRHEKRHDIWTDGERDEAIPHHLKSTRCLQKQSCRERKGRPNMRFQGKAYKDGKFWLVEIPIIDVMTQGRTRKEAYIMAKDIVESLANRPDFSVTVHPGNGGKFEISANEPRGLICLLLRRQREKSGMTISEVSQRLGAKSRNAYARYERGSTMPSLEKLTQLYKAVAPGKDIVLIQSNS
jgi:predicted RNA binding protein YcfA (HicA-like mRNA interferase family)/DNA-binding XRE family transcriptional regulator